MIISRPILLLAGVLFFFSINAQTKLSSIINSGEIEFSPSVSADGKTMVYHSNRDGKYLLYIAHQNASGEWSSSNPIQSINKFGDANRPILGANLSHDGNTIYFFASLDGSVGREDIWYVQRMGTEWSEPINVGNLINSPGYEGFPNISPDGNHLYFVRFASPQKYSGKYCYRIFVSERDQASGQWKRAVPVTSPIFGGCENCPEILPDNETLVFSAIRGEPSKTSNYDLYQSKYLGNDKWSTPVPMTFLNTDEDDLTSTFPASGKYMYYNLREETNFEIYRTDVPEEFRPQVVVNLHGTTKVTQSGKPVEATFDIYKNSVLVDRVGTKSNSFDGSYMALLKSGAEYKLVARSLGHLPDSFNVDLRGINSYQQLNHDFKLPVKEHTMFITVRNNTNLERLTANVTVNGKKLEVSGPEMMYPFSAEYGTIYQIRVNKPGFPEHIDSLKLRGTETNSSLFYTAGLVAKKPQLNIKIMDSGTRKPILSKILVYDTKDNKVVYEGLLNDGTLSLEADFARLYKYKAIGVNHFYQQGDLDLTEVVQYKEVNHTISLTQLKVGAKLTLNLHFDFGSYELTKESKDELENVFAVLGQNQNVVMEISAHTDDIGTVAENQDLSTKRAQSVYDYLVSRGVPKTMLTSRGYGELKPAVPNTSDKNRAENRRVDFIVKEVH